jgi:hypothetical protein
MEVAAGGRFFSQPGMTTSVAGRKGVPDYFMPQEESNGHAAQFAHNTCFIAVAAGLRKGSSNSVRGMEGAAGFFGNRGWKFTRVSGGLRAISSGRRQNFCSDGNSGEFHYGPLRDWQMSICRSPNITPLNSSSADMPPRDLA